MPNVSLWKWLELDPRVNSRVAFVGGGGKTSILYALGREAAAQDLMVLMSTTTHMRVPIGYRLCRTSEQAQAALWSTGVALAGVPTVKGDRFGPLRDLDACATGAQVVLIEADGSRNLPLKVPAAHEPVIPVWINTVVAVAGLDSLGRPISETCYRPDIVSKFLGVSEQHKVTPADVMRMLSSTHGGRKDVGDRTFRCVLNKADTPELKEVGTQMVKRLAHEDITACVTAFPEEERENTCWF